MKYFRGVAELKVAVERSGGLVVLAESFGHSVFKDSLKCIFRSTDCDFGLSFKLQMNLLRGSGQRKPGLLARYMREGSSCQKRTSGVIVSVLRIITKAIYPHDASGLRSSANLYFGVSVVIMVICLICYNISNKLPIIQYYKDLKTKAQEEKENDKPYLSKSPWKSSLWDITRRVKWLAFARFLIFVVTFSIFPGHITEDVHSQILNDWYPILLIACESLFNLVGTSLPAIYLIKNENVVVTASIARLLFYPLFLGCWYGPAFLQTEIPTATLTCLLRITNGYLGNVLLILPPKTVPIQHAEAAGIVMIVFTNLGLLVGSIASWLWII